MTRSDGISTRRYPWLWDEDMDGPTFERILRGETALPGRDWKWALVRLIEYAPYDELRRLLPRELFLARWPEAAPLVRSAACREGMDYLHRYLQRQSRSA